MVIYHKVSNCSDDPCINRTQVKCLQEDELHDYHQNMFQYEHVVTAIEYEDVKCFRMRSTKIQIADGSCIEDKYENVKLLLQESSIRIEKYSSLDCANSTRYAVNIIEELDQNRCVGYWKYAKNYHKDMSSSPKLVSSKSQYLLILLGIFGV